MAFDSYKIKTSEKIIRESKGDKKKQKFLEEEERKKDCIKNKKIIALLSHDAEEYK